MLRLETSNLEFALKTASQITRLSTLLKYRSAIASGSFNHRIIRAGEAPGFRPCHYPHLLNLSLRCYPALE
jgi:hypothetical protein